MSKYLCEVCKFNNNGWCKQKRMNGLKKLNIQECEEYKGEGSKLILEKDGKDYYGQELVIIKINNESVEVPLVVLKDFIEKESCQIIEINIPQ